MEKVNFTKKVKKYVPFALVVLGVAFLFNRRSNFSISVRRVNVSNREIRKTLSASGVVKSEGQVDLSFPLTGVISKINVSEGDTIKKGQLLAYIDPSAQIQTVQSYKDARDIRIRQKDIFEEEKKSNKQLLGGEDAYNIKLREYEESISQAEALYQAQLSVLSNYYIYAPFDGTIVGVEKKEGETISMGMVVVKLANLGELIFEVNVDQEDFGFISEGQSVEVRLDAYEDRIYMGTVNKVPLFADQLTGSFTVKIDFNDENHGLKLGLVGDAFMILSKTEGEVQSLSFNEVFYDEDSKPFIWTVEDGKIQKLMVDVGLEGDIYTEIKTDLSNKIIVVPAKDGLEVKDGFTAKIIN